MLKPFSDPSQWIPRELFSAYCGSDARMLQYYDLAANRKSLIVMRPNWVAAILSPFWLAYRGQWPVWCSLVGLIGFLVPVLEFQLGLTVPASGLACALIALGSFGEGMILAQANQRFAKLKAAGASQQQMARELTARAKPNFEMAMAGGLSAIVVCILAAQLFQITSARAPLH